MHAATTLTNFHSFDDVEETLRAIYVERRTDDAGYLVRFIGTAGEPGQRCLTLQLEMRDSYHAAVKEDLDALLATVRARGYTVDELLQRVEGEARFDVRLWLLIYETAPQAEAS